MERIGNLIGGIPAPKKDSADSSPKPATADGQKKYSNRYNSSRDSEYRHHIRYRRPGVTTDFAKIKGILSKALAFKGIDKKLERYEFILHWEEIVGEKLAEVSKPDYISRRTLLVRVLHPVWAQELTFMKAGLLYKLAPYLKRGDVIDDMVFRVGPLEG